MRIDKISVRPEKESINAELIFEIEIFFQRRYEIPIEITGYLFSNENKKIANIHEFFYEPNKKIVLSARNTRNEGEEKLIIKLIAPLNYKVLDYIETLRTLNSKGDVILDLDIFVKTLISKTNLSHMCLIEKLEETPYHLPNGYEDALPVFYRYKSGFYQKQTDMWILSGEGGPEFIEVINNNFKNKVTVPSSDWIHDYCPAFQIGKFLIFEYLLPDCSEGSETLKKRLNESINAVNQMKANIVKGEWNDVIEDSRPVWELLRDQNKIKDLFIRDGYTEVAFNNINESIKNLFNYSSKFLHKVDKEGKKIMSEIKASKEDAYLIYSTAITIVNLISKKIQKLS